MDLETVAKYAFDHTTNDSVIVREVISRTEQELEYSNMLSGKTVGRLLAMLIKVSGARRVLEVGTFTGYSALTMAEALPEDGELITCEYNERYEEIAQTYFNKSVHSQKISLKMGKALETIPTLKGKFDFVFLDADKINYPEYYRMILPRLKERGIMAIDNVLWSGEVLDPQDEKARAIDKLNKTIAEDERVEQVMLTVRDGLTLVRKK
ncbi:MAG TPA: class I SAM-dependent methyltransferase [Balneolaceae bacterium]|nr:class I SAM-dependent methyltransferase [Balneolaceae bacterium]